MDTQNEYYKKADESRKKYFELLNTNPGRADMYKKQYGRYMKLYKQSMENEKRKSLLERLKEANEEKDDDEVFQELEELDENEKLMNELKAIEEEKADEGEEKSEDDLRSTTSSMLPEPSLSSQSLSSQSSFNPSLSSLSLSSQNSLNPSLSSLSLSRQNSLNPSLSSPSLSSPSLSSLNLSSQSSLNPSLSERSNSIISDMFKPIGFSETLKPGKKSVTRKSVNKNICSSIFTNGLNVNTEYFYPSEFPNLTKIKSVPIRNIRGGKRSGKRSMSRRRRRSVKQRKTMS